MRPEPEADQGSLVERLCRELKDADGSTFPPSGEAAGPPGGE